MWKTFQAAPLPTVVTSWVFQAARRWVYPDKRAALFAAALKAAAENWGDYLEFDVFRGTSFIMAYKMAMRYEPSDMRFFAFDSFQGLPESEGAVMKKGEWASPRTVFERVIRKGGVDPAKVVTVEGLFSETLDDRLKHEHELVRAAVVHVDCDLYSSTKDVLRFVEDIVGPGTILIFDYWYSFRKNETVERWGERRAYGEWSLNDRFVEFYDVPNHIKAFVMRKP